MMVRRYSSRKAIAAVPAPADWTAIIGGGAATAGLVSILGLVGLEPLPSTQGADSSALASLLTVKLGSSAFTSTVVNGLPSTGQKLNLSANSSSHLVQNFINTTSSRLWGSSID